MKSSRSVFYHVQPLISENPPAIIKDTEESSTSKSIAGQPSTFALTTQSTVKGRQQTQQLVKQVLSRELQLYYARLTSSLLPPVPEDYVKRTTALASLRHDAGLQALLPYLVRWVAEGVVNTLRTGSQTEADGRVLEVLLDVISALLDNSRLFRRAIRKLPHGSLDFANVPSYSCINSYHQSCLFYSIHRCRPHTRRIYAPQRRKRCRTS